MEEIWRPIKGYEGLYEVSNLGNVKSLTHITTYICNGYVITKEVKGRLMKRCLAKIGYYIVALYKNKKAKYEYIHRLVAKAFLENHYGYRYINHKDEVKTNNFVFVNDDGSIDTDKSNLEWCTQKHNCNWGTSRARLSASRRANPINNKRIAQLSLDGKLIRIFNTAADAADAVGVKYPSIIGCCRGYKGYKTSNGYKWKYADEL